MSGLYRELPGQLEPFETPFDTAGRPARPCKFVYLTNRGEGRYSGLLPMDHALGWRLTEYFPMGYAQMWELEKRYAAHPEPGASAAGGRDNRRTPRVRYPAELDRLDWRGKLFIVLREPISAALLHDVIGAALNEEQAVAKAAAYARAYGRRAVVGFLVGDTAWH